MENANNNYQENQKSALDKALIKEQGSLVGFFVKNHRFTYLIILAFLILGTYAMLTLPREANPEVKIPFAVVTTVYPGATPTDMEDLVTDKIEDKVKNLANLRRYTSSSGQGVSTVFVEFEAEADLKDSLQKLRDAVDTAKAGLPDDAQDPVVTEINATDIPIVTYSLVGDFADSELKSYADALKKNFEQINNVSKVVVLGELEREFQVIADQTKLISYQLSLGQVVGAIARSNLSLPGGTIDIDGFTYNVRVDSRYEAASSLNDLVVTTYQNSPVYLKDIALIKDRFRERQTESRIGFNGNEPQNTISLQVYKKTGGNILDIVTATQAEIDGLYQGGTLPAELKIQKTNDNSVFIREDLRKLSTNGLQTMILIILVLITVLSLRDSLITALSVPFAFFMAFIFLLVQDMTLNSIVLFSLVLSLGLMVDNSIVIISGINEYITRCGKTPYEAALLSVWNYKWPITAGTLTTVAAFLPMLLVSGILGEYIAILPKTISATLLSSLFVAIIVVPTIVSRWLKVSVLANGTHTCHDQKRHRQLGRIVSGLIEKYKNFLRAVLSSQKKRRSFIAAVWVIFMIAMLVPVMGFIRIEMFPKIDTDYFVVNIGLPAGSTLERTNEVTARVEKIIAQLPETDNYVTNLGTSVSVGLSEGGSNGTHKANVTVNLVDENDRDRKSYDIAKSLRPAFEQIQDAEITVDELSAGPPTGSAIEVRITGEDTERLAKISGDIKTYFASVPGVINPKDSLEDASGDFTFSIDKTQANYYGLDAASVAGTLRNAVYGTTASTINLAGEDIDIIVKYDKEKFNNVSDLENILLMTARGPIPLKQIASLKLEPSLLAISHRDGERQVAVSANLEKGANLRQILSGFAQWQKAYELPRDYFITVGGELEDIEQSYRETFLSLIVAIILIAFILVLEFNSFRQPFVIIFTLPLSIIGVILGLVVFGLPFSFPAFIGIVSLAGIAVNNAIVLIDQANKNVANKMDFVEAVVEGGASRLQPIFLTSVTTIAGILPLAFSDEFWRGLSVSIAFGLAFSTLLTLFVIPMMYVGLCRSEKCLKTE